MSVPLPGRRRVSAPPWLDQLLQDVRYALRQLARAPGFTAVAVLTLALGIAGITTQFSVVNAALLRGLPFREPERLMNIALRNPAWTAEQARNPPWSMLERAGEQTSFEALAAYFTRGSFIVTIGGTPQRFAGSHVTPNLFALLGVKPARGRDFAESDNRIEAARVTIISDSLWETEFARDPQVVGRRIRLNGRPAEIVGVMPPGFEFPRDQLWMPAANEYQGLNESALSGSPHGFIGRLKPGVTPEQASAEWSTFAKNVAAETPKYFAGLTEARVKPLQEALVGRQARTLLLTLLGAVAVVLVIACINVMNMQFARGVVRTRELGVRSALGATTWRLVNQLLVENLVIVVLGGALGVLIARAVVNLLPAALAAQAALPTWMTYQVDGRVLAFTAAAMAASLLLAGLVPALLAARADPVSVLKDGGRTTTGGRIGRITSALVVGQIGLTCVLLIASSLLVKSIARQYALDFGYDTTSVLIARMNLEVEYPAEEARRLLFDRMLAELRTDAHFTHAAITTRRSLMLNALAPFTLAGEAARPEQDPRSTWYEVVSDGYFAALGLVPLRGREFEPGDAGRAPVLVNASFARKYFGSEDAVGKTIVVGDDGRRREVVGVMPDTLMQGPLDSQADGAGIFLPLQSFPASYVNLVVRGHVTPEALTESLRRAVAKINPNLAIYATGSPANLLASTLAPTRLVVSIFTAFGSIAVLLAGVGLYGVTSFSVSQRTQEYGIRMALGATRFQVMTRVLRQGGVRLAVGVVAGFGLTLALVHVGRATIHSFLYQVSPSDPVVYGAVGLGLTAVTLLACFVPARRATRVDPMTALRCE